MLERLTRLLFYKKVKTPKFNWNFWTDNEYTAYELLKRFPWLPNQFKEKLKGNKIGKVSNKAIFRALEQGAITINGKKPKPKDIITFPIEEFVFFKGGKNQITIR